MKEKACLAVLTHQPDGREGGKNDLAVPSKQKKTAGNKPVMDSTFIIGCFFIKKENLCGYCQLCSLGMDHFPLTQKRSL